MWYADTDLAAGNISKGSTLNKHLLTPTQCHGALFEHIPPSITWLTRTACSVQDDAMCSTPGSITMHTQRETQTHTYTRHEWHVYKTMGKCPQTSLYTYAHICTHTYVCMYTLIALRAHPLYQMTPNVQCSQQNFEMGGGYAIIIMGGAAASETLIGGYICTIGGCSTPQKQPRENTANVHIIHTYVLEEAWVAR